MNLLDQIKDAGIIGAGGAGFPTHAKLTSEAEYILMNGAECEPLLRVDQQLMAIYPDEIIKGFAEAGRLVNAKKAIIGIKSKHGEVIELLKERIKALQLDGYVEVGELPDVYPAGDEQVLVYQLTGRVVPETGIPIMVGCVVVNSETALNIYKASQGIPVTEKYITVTGDVPNRVTVKVPVGTPVMDVLKLSGIEDFTDYAVIDGGPMMGPVKTDIGGFITKKNKGFVILKKSHFLIRKKSVTMEQARRVNKATCEQCRMCTDMCPRYLLGHNMQPHKMMRVLNYKIDDLEGQKIAQLCDFPPLNCSCYPAVPEKYIVPRENPWIPSEKAFEVMGEIARQAGDRTFVRWLEIYRKLPFKWVARKLAGMLHRTKHIQVTMCLSEKLREASSGYGNRSFGKEADEELRVLTEKARTKQAELNEQGMGSEVLREEPFTIARDSLGFKVYLMKWNKGRKDCTVEIEEI